MSAESLPSEMLEVIFKQVSGKDATNCRAVCRRWRESIDSLPDEVWRDYCKQEYWNAEAAYEKADLTYRQLYKSIALWSKVETAEIKCKQLHVPNPNQFKILKNTLAVTYNSGDTIFRSEVWNSNTIEYYNLKTLVHLSRERFKFWFHYYDENDKLTTMINYKLLDIRLCIIPKSNKNMVFIGNLRTQDYTLLDTEVYYVNKRRMLCVARLVEENGTEVIKSIELDKLLHEKVVSFCNASKNRVYILTNDGNIYHYSNIQKEFVGLNKIDRSTYDIVRELRTFGFDWTQPNIYEWIKKFFDQKFLTITKQRSTVLCCHNHVILMGTYQQLLHVFKRPYNENGDLILHSSKPDRSIDIGRFCEWKSMGKQINQVDTVEIQNGHKIIVLNKDTLFVLDLVHEEESRFPFEDSKNQDTAAIFDNSGIQVAKSNATTSNPATQTPQVVLQQIITLKRKSDENCNAATSATVQKCRITYQ